MSCWPDARADGRRVNDEQTLSPDLHRKWSSSRQFGDRKLPADLAGKVLANLDMSRNGLNRASFRVDPERVFTALTLQPATVSLQVAEQIAAFHQTRMEVCSAPLGAFSSPRSRL